MKFIIEIAQGASFFTRTAWKKTLEYCGHQVVLWEPNGVAAHDIFNMNPDIDIAILNSYSLNKPLYDIITNRKSMKVALYGSCNGPVCKDIDLKKYPIVVANEEEIKWVSKLYDRISTIFLHCTPKYADYTMSWWNSAGVKHSTLMNAADLFTYYKPKFDMKYACLIGYCGGYWPYKGERLNQYLIRHCNEYLFSHNIKIFGYGDWGIPQYLGSLGWGEDAKLFKTAIISPNISEAHSIDCYSDIIERCFKVPCADGFLITDNAKGLDEIFSKVPVYDSYEQFCWLIDYYMNNDKERQESIKQTKKEILANHTYFDRMATLLTNLCEVDSAEHILNKKVEFLNVN